MSFVFRGSRGDIESGFSEYDPERTSLRGHPYRPANSNSLAFLITVILIFMILNSPQMLHYFLLWVVLAVFVMATSLRMYATCQQLQAQARAHAATASGLLGHTELRFHMPPSIAIATRGRLQGLRLQLALLDQEFEAEDQKHGDFIRLDHVEGYLELSAKTKTYFATTVNMWDADFYIKVDDDVHVNIATLGETLVRHRSKPRVYIGCMKSGPVLSQKGVRYHEPEYWKFGETGNKYFRHATGQLYAVSKDLATYISINKNVLHKYANEP